MPSAPDPSAVGQTLGNVLPLNQQTNILDNPTLEGFIDLTLTTTPTEIFSAAQILGGFRTIVWLAAKTAGTAAACRVLSNTGRDQQAGNPFHSAAPSVIITPSGSGTHEVIITSAATLLDHLQVTAELPFLIAAFAIADLRTASHVLTNVTSRTAILELYNVTDAVVVASETADLAAMLAPAQGSVYRLVAVKQAPTLDKSYQVRLRIQVVTSGAAAALEYMIGEPQMQLSYTGAPGPFTPAVSGWHPTTAVFVGSAGGLPVILGGVSGENNWRVRIHNNGAVQFGSGTAAPDAQVWRQGTEVLRFDNPTGATGLGLELVKMTAPAAPGANMGRLFIRDNGAGKMQLCVRFPTGAIQVISTEP
jgi:hypothetical protein